MENIINKIEALQPEHDLVESYENEPTYDQGWDRAIRAVIDLLDSEMEWKDRPDEQGWWWILGWKTSIHPVYVNRTLDIFRDCSGDHYDISNYKGKWQKILEPIGAVK